MIIEKVLKYLQSITRFNKVIRHALLGLEDDLRNNK